MKQRLARDGFIDLAAARPAGAINCYRHSHCCCDMRHAADIVADASASASATAWLTCSHCIFAHHVRDILLCHLAGVRLNNVHAYVANKKVPTMIRQMVPTTIKANGSNHDKGKRFQPR